MKRALMALSVIVIAAMVGAVIFFVMTMPKKEADEPVVETPEDTQVARTSARTTQETPPAARTIVWQLTPKPADATGVSWTSVVLMHGTAPHDLGTVPGTCTEIKGSAWSLATDEVSGIICLWSGGGNEFGIFKEGDTYVLKQGSIAEGAAATPGARGSYKTVITLE